MNLPLFPLHTVLFPGMALPLHIFEPRYRQMVEQCLAASRPFGVVLIRAGQEVGAPAVPHEIGVTARITGVERAAGGRLNIETVGEERFRLRETRPDGDLLTAEVDLLPLPSDPAGGDQRLVRALAPWLRRYLEVLGQAAQTELRVDTMPDHPVAMAYLAAIIAQVPMLEKQTLLAAASAAEMLRAERRLLRREVGLLRAMLARGSPNPGDGGGYSLN
jgi:Lon protease-like protein